MLEVERHITEYGVEEFIVGNYGRFDRLAANVVMQLKEQYPNIKLVRLLAYHPSERTVISMDGFDDTYYPTGLESVPRRLAIVKANRSTVDLADYLIAYVCHPASNARALLEYAQRPARKASIMITNLGEVNTADAPV